MGVGIYMKAKCLKEYGVSLTEGKVYDVTFPPDAKNGINVFDNTGDWYGYPKDWFEVIKDETAE